MKTGGTSYTQNASRRKAKVGLAAALAVPNTGGTPYDPYAKKPSPKPTGQTAVGGFTQPPSFSYDPAIEAERRAAQRGLSDKRAELKTEDHFAKTNLHQALRDIRVKTTRSRQDTLTGFNRGQQKLGFEQADTEQRAARSREDFGTQLATIGRQFAQLGHRQAEGANAAGVNDAGTAAASAAARAQSQGLAEAPIHTAEGRLNEDLATALSRIGVARQQLTTDRNTTLGRLVGDRNRDRHRSHQEFDRGHFLRERTGQQATREAKIADVDLLMSEIYQARQNRPGVFSKTGAKQQKGKKR